MTPEPLSYPARLEIKPVSHAVRGAVRVPGSKSMTNRALVLAALYPPPARADGRCVCTIRGGLRSEDTEVMIDSLSRLGFSVETEWQAVKPEIRVEFGKQSCGTGFLARPDGLGSPSHDVLPLTELFVANSGTSMRFLTAMVSLSHGRFRLDGVPRMRERPIEDLLTALRQLGVHAYSENHNGCPPIIVEANGLSGGPVRMRGDVSSQFLSALLMVAPQAEKQVTIELEGPLVSEPYVAMTLAMMRDIGLTPTRSVSEEPSSLTHGHRFAVPPAGVSAGRATIVIEPDASAASYFFAAAAITGGDVSVAGLGNASLQGDIRFVDVLEKMGCQVYRDNSGLRVQGGVLQGIDVDMNDISDTVMTLAAVACFAAGPTTIRNVAHIRHKETDRLAALAAELRRVGAGVDEFGDGLTITPRPLHGAVVETYNDHRMAMSLALLGLRVPGVIIDNPGCVAKTYPRFFDDFRKLSLAMD